jgi:Flp pilus assembly protein TadG
MTKRPHSFVRRALRLRSDSKGAVAIETALVAPLLILMSVGGFEISEMVARQHELQGGASEATAVALAANQGTETDVNTLKELLVSSLDVSANDVTVTKIFRCDADNTYVALASDCDGANDEGRKARRKQVSTYVRIEITDTYTPTWSKIGVSGPLTYEVERTIQLS